ncbi:DNA polymerase IV [Serinicoccus sp. CNJ-927]|uniref:DNA polymerase IV n=1 Tax=Serinicoccus sp. CNJ-927 TaxID=1904970 RepID=UPI0009643A76|nr:DNA polymerase IV [Serinicoccus sp. CNJ-927]OLT44024.1 DNA polymerase IV [Serinicoccus sp. CNJ-927]
MPQDARRCIMHLDLDAFFAAVEQRDKPSLRGRPVIVGGLGGRGVVATASYEARRYGARSAMPTIEARRRCPAGTAFLAGRFAAYRTTSEVVMAMLRERSPLVEQVSVDEAYVDLTPPGGPLGWDDDVEAWCRELLEGIVEATGGLTASVGLATTKMMAKLASEMDKPAGVTVVRPGEELEVLHALSVRAIPGIGPATASRLHGFGVDTVADLARMSEPDLVSIFGTAHGGGLHRLARGEDDRRVVVEREAKSISVEGTFEHDVSDRSALESELARMSRGLAGRLERTGVFARTITVKARQHDFTTQTRSGTLPFATGDAGVIEREGRRLLRSVDVTSGLRLLGLGVAGLTAHAQEELSLETAYPELGEVALPDAVGALEDASDARDVVAQGGDGADEEEPPRAVAGRMLPGWRTGQDVRHDEHGTGWVWGSGRGVVTVRFEGPRTAPGPVRSFREDDPALHQADPPEWRDPPP